MPPTAELSAYALDVGGEGGGSRGEGEQWHDRLQVCAGGYHHVDLHSPVVIEKGEDSMGECLTQGHSLPSAIVLLMGGERSRQ